MKNLVGLKFGKLTVISYSHCQGRWKKHYWNCRCECGKSVKKREGHILYGQSISCGCMLNRKGKSSPHFKGCGELPMKYYSGIRDGSHYKHRNFEFSVSIEFLWNLFLKQNRQCALTGWVIKFPSVVRLSDGTASLDRIDSAKGYVEGNVQWVHKDINRMKSDFDQQYFLDICKQIVENTTK